MNKCFNCHKRCKKEDFICNACFKKAKLNQISATIITSTPKSQAAKEREIYAKDILQPLTREGKINKHFVEAYGTNYYKKELKLNKEQFYRKME